MSITRGHLCYEINDKKRNVTFEIGRALSDIDIEIISYIVLENQGLRVNVDIIPKEEIKIKELYLVYTLEYKEEDKIFVNGYQTWTDSKEFSIDENIPKLNKLVWPLLSPYGDYKFYKRKKRTLHSWTYSYVRSRNNEILLFGSISEKEGFTILEHYKDKDEVRIKKDCNNLLLNSRYNAFSLFISQGKEENVFDNYFKAMNIQKPRVKKTLGWTSWYNYYTDITEEIILENLEAFVKNDIPIDIFQIDDGYQESVGDWLKIRDKFPRGMEAISDRIHEEGYKAGIWLAPFICEKKSDIYKKHKDWILKDKKGRMIKAGFNPGWSGTFYAIDIYNTAFRQYLKEVFDTALNKWNYDMVKLDFLYAAALNPREDKTKGQIMHEGMVLLRELVGDKIILGCGVPLGSAFGLTDYCRIGGDVALKWEDKILKKAHYRERVSTVNSLISTIGRRHLNKRGFCNDPDVFILRSENQEMSNEEKLTLFLINQLLGDLLFISDNLNNYSQDELKLYRTLFEFKNSNIKEVIDEEVLRIAFESGGDQYLALSNLKDEEQVCFLEAGDYVEKFKGYTINGNREIRLKPHSSICIRRIS